MSLVFEGSADVRDREILLAQRNDLVTDSLRLRGSLRPFGRGQKEWAVRILTQLMAENPKAARCVTQASGRFSRRKLFDKISSQRFVLAMS